MGTESTDLRVLVRSPERTLDALARGRATAGPGPLADVPLLVVDLDRERERLDELGAAVHHRSLVVVGVSDSQPPTDRLDPFDVLLAAQPAGPPWRSCPDGVDAALVTLAGAVRARPQAATTLVEVLRMGADLSFVDALVAESHAYAMLEAGPEHRAWLGERWTTPGQDGGASPPPGSEPVRVARDGDALVVTLRRPETGNVVDEETAGTLAAAFALAAGGRNGRCPTAGSGPAGHGSGAAGRRGMGSVDLRADGPDFCRGNVSGGATSGLDPVAGHLARSRHSPARALAAAGARVTAHVHGTCAGAGLELAALADRVVVASDTAFLLPDLAAGLIPGAGGTVTLPRRIGRRLTAWMALTGEPVDAVTALAWGLADIGPADTADPAGDAT